MNPGIASDDDPRRSIAATTAGFRRTAGRDWKCRGVDVFLTCCSNNQTGKRAPATSRTATVPTPRLRLVVAPTWPRPRGAGTSRVRDTTRDPLHVGRSTLGTTRSGGPQAPGGPQCYTTHMYLTHGTRSPASGGAYLDCRCRPVGVQDPEVVHPVLRAIVVLLDRHRQGVADDGPRPFLLRFERLHGPEPPGTRVFPRCRNQPGPSAFHRPPDTVREERRRRGKTKGGKASHPTSPLHPHRTPIGAQARLTASTRRESTAPGPP
jgi:hypothetical protein